MFLKNMFLRMKVYGCFKLRSRSKFYDDVFEAVFSQRDTWLKVFKTDYNIYITTSNGFKVAFWIANKYYAYGDEIAISEWDARRQFFVEVTPSVRNGRLSRKNQYKLALLERELDCLKGKAQKEQVSEIVNKIGGGE